MLESCSQSTSVTAAFVCNPDSQGQKCKEMMSALLGAYFRCALKFEYKLEAVSQDFSKLFWLKINCKFGFFAIALDKDWESAEGLQSLIDFLYYNREDLDSNSSQFILGISPNIYADFFAPIVSQFKFSNSSAEVLAWIIHEKDFQFPRCSLDDEYNWPIKIAIYADAGAGLICGNLCLSSFILKFYPSEIFPQITYALIGELRYKDTQQLLVIKECAMNDNINIKTALRIGVLELKLADLFSLKPGSEIYFSLPNKAVVELEVAGQVFGRGHLIAEEKGFLLEMTEMTRNII